MGLSYSAQPKISQVSNETELNNILKLWMHPVSYFQDKMSVTNDKIILMLNYLIKKHSDSCYYYSTKELFEMEWYLEIDKTRKYEFVYLENTLKKLLLNESEICKDKRFILIPLYMRIENKIENTREAHQNILIYDREMNTIERFEPHGYSEFMVKLYGQSRMDAYLRDYFSKDFGIQYIPPKDYCPSKYGFQTIECDQENKCHDTDPAGFCAFWSIFYADLRLSYPNVSRKKIVEHAAKEFKNMENVTAFIRSYGVFILNNIQVIKERPKRRLLVRR